MAEGLRIIPECRASFGVDFLAEQAKIVPKRKEMIEEPLGGIDLAAPRQIVDCPKTADAEGAFLAARIVVARRIAVEQTAAAQFLVDPAMRRYHPGIGGALVADTCHQ